MTGSATGGQLGQARGAASGRLIGKQQHETVTREPRWVYNGRGPSQLTRRRERRAEADELARRERPRVQRPPDNLTRSRQHKPAATRSPPTNPKTNRCALVEEYHLPPASSLLVHFDVQASSR